MEDELNLDHSLDGEFFLYIASVYYGFAIPLAKTMNNSSSSDDGIWQSSWTRNAIIPTSLFAYCVASFYQKSSIIEEEYLLEFPDEFSEYFSLSASFMLQKVN